MRQGALRVKISSWSNCWSRRVRRETLFRLPPRRASRQEQPLRGINRLSQFVFDPRGALCPAPGSGLESPSPARRETGRLFELFGYYDRSVQHVMAKPAKGIAVKGQCCMRAKFNGGCHLSTDSSILTNSSAVPMPIVQPSVPWPVFSQRLRSFSVRPT